jgi:hypothetical protein
MGPKLAEMDAVLQRLHLSLTQDAVRAGTRTLLVLVRGLGRRQLRESGAASRQLVASKDTPSLACNRHVPCPTQRTHAMRLWVARTQHGTVCPPF